MRDAVMGLGMLALCLWAALAPPRGAAELRVGQLRASVSFGGVR